MGWKKPLRAVGQRVRALWAKPTEPLGTPRRITIHHTASKWPPWMIGVMHRAKRGYSGIGYHYLVGRGGFWTKEGKVYRGRPENMKGAHVLNDNTGNIGIALVGNLHKGRPTERQIKALENLVVDLVKRHKLSVDDIFGHRDLKEGTVCPGEHFDLAAFKIRVQRRLAAPGRQRQPL